MILPIRTLFGRAGGVPMGVPPIIAPGIDPVTGLAFETAADFAESAGRADPSLPAQYSGGLPIAFLPTGPAVLQLNTGQVNGESSAYDDTRDRAWEAWRRAGKSVPRGRAYRRCGSLGDVVPANSSAAWDALVQNAITTGVDTTAQIALMRSAPPGAMQVGPGGAVLYGQASGAIGPGGAQISATAGGPGLLLGVAVVLVVGVWLVASKK